MHPHLRVRSPVSSLLDDASVRPSRRRLGRALASSGARGNRTAGWLGAHQRAPRMPAAHGRCAPAAARPPRAAPSSSARRCRLLARHPRHLGTWRPTIGRRRLGRRRVLELGARVELASAIYETAVLPLNYPSMVAVLVAGAGVEPASPAYETGVLPLNDPAVSRSVLGGGAGWNRTPISGSSGQR